jgi:hypothetical protein
VELAGLKSEKMSQTMTDTIDVVTADPVVQVPAAPAIDQGVAEQLVAQARGRAIELVRP